MNEGVQKSGKEEKELRGVQISKGERGGENLGGHQKRDQSALVEKRGRKRGGLTRGCTPEAKNPGGLT